MGKKNTLSAYYAEILENQRIDEDSAGSTIVRDFETLLGFIGSNGIQVSGEYNFFQLKALAYLNSQMTNPIEIDLKRPQQKSYPNIHGLYLLLRVTGLTCVNAIGKKQHLFLDEAVLESWDGLNLASLSLAEDEELMRLAAKSGCMGVFIGLESIDQTTLTTVRKHTNVAAKYEKALKKLHSFGICVQGSFIFGFDDDDESIFERTVRFAQKAKLELVEFNILTPYPGTQIYKEFDEQGRMLTKNWSKYDNSNVVFVPKLISVETLAKGTCWAWKEFYKTSSIYSRIGIFHRYPFSVWALNLFTRNYYSQLF